ncbi:MAG: hypothetical protein HWN68_18190 [Desulfobacterales bacterium]|nr:hypothetical protein [Desulfobacterales bacterium]
MKDDGILDGDFVVVRKQPTAENGETVVALMCPLKNITRGNVKWNFGPPMRGCSQLSSGRATCGYKERWWV